MKCSHTIHPNRCVVANKSLYHLLWLAYLFFCKIMNLNEFKYTFNGNNPNIQKGLLTELLFTSFQCNSPPCVLPYLNDCFELATIVVHKSQASYVITLEVFGASSMQYINNFQVKDLMFKSCIFPLL